MKHYFTVLRKYACVEGRASRAEYWNFLLFNYLVSVVLTVIEVSFRTNFIVMTYTVAMVLPSLAVGMRRMHDLGKYGSYALIPIYSQVLACFPGSKAANAYDFIPQVARP
ncbi:DUF805 domain-containing protein [Hymenobacter cheonanensis]|uniref:DUF805 domain-containing protein n=1 Tax=Hymenobacter sp. CA2-7 TaxID=3063993 RepID=UPI0027137451|nr:DUF805 domain-containing protein [Hymenobacter sp. CA2-7]MDO7883765.1 DUF805 domain-containing protein [Hymenobacter sp. CA2-7]